MAAPLTRNLQNLPLCWDGFRDYTKKTAHGEPPRNSTPDSAFVLDAHDPNCRSGKDSTFEEGLTQ
jgi:hypothetical protein